MSLDTNDVGALVYIARRVRPLGATKWDEAGIAKFVRDLENRGFGFDEILDRITIHGRDRSAKTPAVLLHAITGQPTGPIAPRNPTRDQQCTLCGLRKTQCVCDPRERRRPQATPEQRTAYAELARAGIAAARGDGS